MSRGKPFVRKLLRYLRVLPDYEFSRPKKNNSEYVNESLRPPSRLRRRNLKTEVSLWKRIKCFPSTPRRRHLKTQQSPRSFWICVWRRLSQGNHIINGAIVFEKLRTKMFFVLRFQIAPFSWRISVGGRPNRRNKAVFSIFFGLVPWRLPYIPVKQGKNWTREQGRLWASSTDLSGLWKQQNAMSLLMPHL